MISVDIDGRFGADIVEDILQLNYCRLAVPDVIWASPPCDQYARCRTRANKPRNLTLADSLVAKAIDIITYFQKLNTELIWFIENGDSTLLWGREVARGLTDYVVVDYCRFNGPGYRKRTRIAHSENIQWSVRSLCDPKTCLQCDGGRHILTAQQGHGKKVGVRDRQDKCSVDMLHALPSELADEILWVCATQRRHILG